ncbi:sushi domain-containing protein 6, partial [Clarias magur]
MCDGMATRSHALVIVALQLLLFLLTALPTGQASGCSRPSEVLHGRGNLTETNRGSFSVGTVLQYSCDPGYTLSGESVITCTAPGR